MSESETPPNIASQSDENIFGTPVVPSNDPLPDLTPREAELAQSWQRTTQNHTERTEDKLTAPNVDTAHTPEFESMKTSLAEFVHSLPQEQLDTLSMEEIPEIITPESPRRFETYGVDYDSFVGELIHQQTQTLNKLGSHLGDTETAKQVIFPTILRNTTREVKAQKKIKELDSQLYTDVLTQTLNTNYFKDRLPEVIAQDISENRQIAMLFLDTDDFKSINDAINHEYGDQVIQRISNILTEHVRDLDLVIHRSGDEFVLLLRNVTPEKAVEIAERIRKAGESTEMPDTKIGKPSPSISFSIGIATSATAKTDEEFKVQAEVAMHNSKRDMQGNPQKNRVTTFEEGMVTPPGGEKGRSTNTDTTAQE